MPPGTVAAGAARAAGAAAARGGAAGSSGARRAAAAGRWRLELFFKTPADLEQRVIPFLKANGISRVNITNKDKSDDLAGVLAALRAALPGLDVCVHVSVQKQYARSADATFERVASLCRALLPASAGGGDGGAALGGKRARGGDGPEYSTSTRADGDGGGGSGAAQTSVLLVSGGGKRRALCSLLVRSRGARVCNPRAWVALGICCTHGVFDRHRHVPRHSRTRR